MAGSLIGVRGVDVANVARQSASTVSSRRSMAIGFGLSGQRTGDSFLTSSHRE